MQRTGDIFLKQLLTGRITSLASIGAAFLCATGVYAQPKITSADFFGQTNLYYRAYSYAFDPADPGSVPFKVPSTLIGDSGPGQLWDFSQGPTDEVLRFDYLSPVGMDQSADFPSAKLVEQETVEGGTSTPQLLFYDLVPGTGRTVYGFYAENSLFTPTSVFVPPIVDFPDPITYGLEWSTSTTYQNTLTLGDPSGDGTSSAGQKVDVSSNLKADAYGTIILTDALGVSFAQGLRVAEAVTYDVTVDLGGGDNFHETDYVRNYYWFVPGYGMVAQLNSTQGTTPVSTNFMNATAFVRMFETNRKIVIDPGGGGGCTDPAPADNFRLRLANGVILLTWSKADCATQYIVQYTTTPAVTASWKPLGIATSNLSWQGENTTNGPARFYRVVSMK